MNLSLLNVCRGALALSLLTLAACESNARVTLEYQAGLTQIVPGPKVVAVGRFVDIRNEDAFVLGAVRTPLGNPVEYVTTNVPVDQVVHNAFAYGLKVRHMLVSDKHAPYTVTGQINQFYVRHVLHPGAYARIRVSLIETRTGAVVYHRDYKADQEAGAVLPGMGSPVPMMKDLASRVLQELVDRAIDDVVFRAKLQNVPPGDRPGPR